MELLKLYINKSFLGLVDLEEFLEEILTNKEGKYPQFAKGDILEFLTKIEQDMIANIRAMVSENPHWQHLQKERIQEVSEEIKTLRERFDRNG